MKELKYEITKFNHRKGVKKCLEPKEITQKAHPIILPTNNGSSKNKNSSWKILNTGCSMTQHSGQMLKKAGNSSMQTTTPEKKPAWKTRREVIRLYARIVKAGAEELGYGMRENYMVLQGVIHVVSG